MEFLKIFHTSQMCINKYLNLPVFNCIHFSTVPRFLCVPCRGSLWRHPRPSLKRSISPRLSSARRVRTPSTNSQTRSWKNIARQWSRTRKGPKVKWRWSSQPRNLCCLFIRVKCRFLLSFCSQLFLTSLRITEVKWNELCVEVSWSVKW